MEGGRGRVKGEGEGGGGKGTYTPLRNLSQAVICYLILSMSLFQGHGIYPKRASLGL